MTPANWLSAAGIAVAVIVPFVIAAQARRQARQIEMHRDNPSVPLKPPLHPVAHWFLKYGVLLCCAVAEAFYLRHLLHGESPLTRAVIFQIVLQSFAVASLLALILLLWFLSIFASTVNFIARSVNDAFTPLRKSHTDTQIAPR